MEEVNRRLQSKYAFMNEEEVRYELIETDGADFLLIAYGLASRIAHRAVEMARSHGMNVGLVRPITLYPFPYKIIRDLAGRVKGMLVIEMNAGQMVEDVRLGVEGSVPVDFYGRMGGIIPTPDEVLKNVREVYQRLVRYRQEGVHVELGKG